MGDGIDCALDFEETSEWQWNGVGKKDYFVENSHVDVPLPHRPAGLDYGRLWRAHK